MITKVFLNLLSNAVKFTAKTDQAFIRIEGNQKENEVMSHAFYLGRFHRKWLKKNIKVRSVAGKIFINWLFF